MEGKINKKIIEVNCNEDGDIYYVIGDVTESEAIKALNNYFKECGIEEDMKGIDLELSQTDFYETSGGDYDGWRWWTKPNKEKYNYKEVKFLSKGWISNSI